MCRMFGCVARERTSLPSDLLEPDSALSADSGWGLAVYRDADGGLPTCIHVPGADSPDAALERAGKLRGRILSAHVRRATVGSASALNAHPFCFGPYTFSHSGTIFDFARMARRGVADPHGQTDSELFFNYLMSDFDPGAVIESLRRTVTAVIALSPFSALNFLFSDGERLYAYRLGIYELHWRPQDGTALVTSEELEGEWHSLLQDVVLVLDPREPDEAHAERLVGEAVVARARIEDPRGAPLADAVEPAAGAAAAAGE